MGVTGAFLPVMLLPKVAVSTSYNEWLRAKGFEWDTSTSAYAAEGGHLFILQ